MKSYKRILGFLSLAIISNFLFAVASYAANPVSCDNSTCNILAQQYLENDGVEKAASLFEKGCELNDSASCYNIATIYTENYYLERDLAKAIPFYKRGCQLKDLESCDDLADEYDDLEDYANALIYYGAACELGSGYGCRGQAWILDNDITPRDLERATALYAKGCELGNGWSCNNLGYDYMGYGDEPNPYAPKDYAKGIKLMSLACDEYGIGNACVSMGNIYGEGHGVKEDYKESLRYLIKACEGVDESNSNGCFLAGVDYEYGNGTKKDKKKALYYYETACEQENSGACWMTATKYEEGFGTKKNKQRAQYFYNLACDLGDEDGCEEIEE